MPSRQIPLTQGRFAIVDAEDYEYLSQFKWHAWWNRNTRSFYARRHSKQPGPALVYMSREIMKAPAGVKIDHKNRETLDNRRGNLRFASATQNQQNRGKNVNNTSGFKGVTWDRRKNKWMAQITVDGKAKFLGYFTVPEIAHEAYKHTAMDRHGEFACTE